MNATKLIAAIIVIALIGLPSLSFARARGGGYGGGYSSGSRSSSYATLHSSPDGTLPSRLPLRKGMWMKRLVSFTKELGRYCHHPMTDARWKATYDFMVNSKLLKPEVDVKKAYTLEFVSGLKIMP